MRSIMRRLLALGVWLLVTMAGGGGQAMDVKNIDIENVPEWEVKSTADGGKLLFSDSPEMVEHDGVLYQDTVQGKARLFFYHVNATRQARRFDVVLENKGKEPAHITVTKSSLGGPGYEWLAVGKEAQLLYLSEHKTYQLTVAPGKMTPLSKKISETAVLPNMLINGIYDFTTDKPVTVKVLMKPLFEDTDVFLKTAKVLPADETHLRGTFDKPDRYLTPAHLYDVVLDGPVAMTLADNEIDRYQEGIDATDGSKVVNYGNYGVVYHIRIPSQRGSHVAYYLAPLGGYYAGGIGITYPDVTWSPLPTPRQGLYFGDDKGKDFAFLGTYDTGEPIIFTFSPPGASNLPVRLLALPQ